MIFEFNILFTLLKKYLPDISMIIDAALIAYVIYLKKELNKKVSRDDLEALKEYLSQLFIHEIKSIKEHNMISIEALNQRISDLQVTLKLLTKQLSTKIH